MSPCQRGCCYTGLQVCARQRACECHWDEKKPAPRGSDSRKFADPTATQAIRNIMKENRTK